MIEQRIHLHTLTLLRHKRSYTQTHRHLYTQTEFVRFLFGLWQTPPKTDYDTLKRRVRKLTMTAIIAGKSAVCYIVKMATAISHIHVHTERIAECTVEMIKMCNSVCLPTRKCLFKRLDTLTASSYPFLLSCFLPSARFRYCCCCCCYCSCCYFPFLLRYCFALYTLNCYYHLGSKREEIISLMFAI